MRARRWAAVGRELERHDPGRRSALLQLGEQIIRAHRKYARHAVTHVHSLKAEIRRLARR